MTAAPNPTNPTGPNTIPPLTPDELVKAEKLWRATKLHLETNPDSDEAQIFRQELGDFPDMNMDLDTGYVTDREGRQHRASDLARLALSRDDFHKALVTSAVPTEISDVEAWRQNSPLAEQYQKIDEASQEHAEADRERMRAATFTGRIALRAVGFMNAVERAGERLLSYPRGGRREHRD